MKDLLLKLIFFDDDNTEGDENYDEIEEINEYNEYEKEQPEEEETYDETAEGDEFAEAEYDEEGNYIGGEYDENGEPVEGEYVEEEYAEEEYPEEEYPQEEAYDDAPLETDVLDDKFVAILEQLKSLNDNINTAVGGKQQQQQQQQQPQAQQQQFNSPFPSIPIFGTTTLGGGNGGTNSGGGAYQDVFVASELNRMRDEILKTSVQQSFQQNNSIMQELARMREEMSKSAAQNMQAEIAQLKNELRSNSGRGGSQDALFQERAMFQSELAKMKDDLNRSAVKEQMSSEIQAMKKEMEQKSELASVRDEMSRLKNELQKAIDEKKQFETHHSQVDLSGGSNKNDELNGEIIRLKKQLASVESRNNSQSGIATTNKNANDNMNAIFSEIAKLRNEVNQNSKPDENNVLLRNIRGITDSSNQQIANEITRQLDNVVKQLSNSNLDKNLVGEIFDSLQEMNGNLIDTSQKVDRTLEEQDKAQQQVVDVAKGLARLTQDATSAVVNKVDTHTKAFEAMAEKMNEHTRAFGAVAGKLNEQTKSLGAMAGFMKNADVQRKDFEDRLVSGLDAFEEKVSDSMDETVSTLRGTGNRYETIIGGINKLSSDMSNMNANNLEKTKAMLVVIAEGIVKSSKEIDLVKQGMGKVVDEMISQNGITNTSFNDIKELITSATNVSLDNIHELGNNVLTSDKFEKLVESFNVGNNEINEIGQKMLDKFTNVEIKTAVISHAINEAVDVIKAEIADKVPNTSERFDVIERLLDDMAVDIKNELIETVKTPLDAVAASMEDVKMNGVGSEVIQKIFDQTTKIATKQEEMDSKYKSVVVAIAGEIVKSNKQLEMLKTGMANVADEIVGNNRMSNESFEEIKQLIIDSTNASLSEMENANSTEKMDEMIGALEKIKVGGVDTSRLDYIVNKIENVKDEIVQRDKFESMMNLLGNINKDMDKNFSSFASSNKKDLADRTSEIDMKIAVVSESVSRAIDILKNDVVRNLSNDKFVELNRVLTEMSREIKREFEQSFEKTNNANQEIKRGYQNIVDSIDNITVKNVEKETREKALFDSLKGISEKFESVTNSLAGVNDIFVTRINALTDSQKAEFDKTMKVLGGIAKAVIDANNKVSQVGGILTEFRSNGADILNALKEHIVKQNISAMSEFKNAIDEQFEVLANDVLPMALQGISEDDENEQAKFAMQLEEIRKTIAEQTAQNSNDTVQFMTKQLDDVKQKISESMLSTNSNVADVLTERVGELARLVSEATNSGLVDMVGSMTKQLKEIEEISKSQLGSEDKIINGVKYVCDGLLSKFDEQENTLVSRFNESIKEIKTSLVDVVGQSDMIENIAKNVRDVKANTAIEFKEIKKELVGHELIKSMIEQINKLSEYTLVDKDDCSNNQLMEQVAEIKAKILNSNSDKDLKQVRDDINNLRNIMEQFANSDQMLLNLNEQVRMVNENILRLKDDSLPSSQIAEIVMQINIQSKQILDTVREIKGIDKPVTVIDRSSEVRVKAANIMLSKLEELKERAESVLTRVKDKTNLSFDIIGTLDNIKEEIQATKPAPQNGAFADVPKSNRPMQELEQSAISHNAGEKTLEQLKDELNDIKKNIDK